MYPDYYGFNEELIDQYLGTLYNLKTLLYIKKELGDYADITDRYFGYSPYCGDSEAVFFRSAIAIILGLNEEQELNIAEEYYIKEDFLKEYPDIQEDIKEEIDEIAELKIPAVYADICEQIEIPKDSGEFRYRRINEKFSHIYFAADEWPFREDLFNFFIKVRKIAEGLEVAA